MNQTAIRLQMSALANNDVEKIKGRNRGKIVCGVTRSRVYMDESGTCECEI